MDGEDWGPVFLVSWVETAEVLGPFEWDSSRWVNVMGFGQNSHTARVPVWLKSQHSLTSFSFLSI